jgi:hypothetical protein
MQLQNCGPRDGSNVLSRWCGGNAVTAGLEKRSTSARLSWHSLLNTHQTLLWASPHSSNDAPPGITSVSVLLQPNQRKNQHTFPSIHLPSSYISQCAFSSPAIYRPCTIGRLYSHYTYPLLPWLTVVPYPGRRVAWGWNILLQHHCVQTDSEAYPASYPKDITVLSSGLKRPVHASDETFPFGGG